MSNVVLLPSDYVFVGNIVIAKVEVDPRTVSILVNNLELPEGSIVYNISSGANNQKFIKLSSGPMDYAEISVSVPSEWNWDEKGQIAWQVLQTI